MAKDYYFKAIKYNDIFSSPDFQKKIKFYAGHENGRFVMGISTTVAEVIEVIGGIVLTGTTMDEEFAIVPGANPKDVGALEFKPVSNPMLDPLLMPKSFFEYLDKRLKNDGVWEFQGYWDADLEWLVFPLKDGKEVEW